MKYLVTARKGDDSVNAVVTTTSEAIPGFSTTIEVLLNKLGVKINDVEYISITVMTD